MYTERNVLRIIWRNATSPKFSVCALLNICVIVCILTEYMEIQEICNNSVQVRINYSDLSIILGNGREK